MKVGDKIKGFKHAGDVEGMQKYIGEIGTIVTLTDYDVEIKFFSWRIMVLSIRRS